MQTKRKFGVCGDLAASTGNGTLGQVLYWDSKNIDDDQKWMCDDIRNEHDRKQFEHLMKLNEKPPEGRGISWTGTPPQGLDKQ